MPSMCLPSNNNYTNILLSNAPLIDLRAPAEFAQGAFPQAVNLPLMTDSEREQVGIAYKNHGQHAAIELGHQLVSGDVKVQRIAHWKQFAEAHPEGYLYCFRGGLRSKISQSWLAESGVEYPRIEGGYKAMRQFLLQQLAQSDQLPLLILGGRTGVAKTRFLQQFSNMIDLEALARHSGSAFGRQLEPQPTPINFENALAIELMRQAQSKPAFILLEDEGRNIGSLSIPLDLARAMRQAPLLILEASLTTRIQHIMQEYVIDKLRQYQNLYGQEQGHTEFSAYLLGSLARIQKRLGGLRYYQLQQHMQQALMQSDSNAHRLWIEHLLRHYYDPMYDYQLQNKQTRIVAQGDWQTLAEWLNNRC